MTTRGNAYNNRTYPVEGLGGGLNKAVSSFKLRDDELRDCKNVRVMLAGSIEPRKGLRKYEVSGDHLTGTNVAATKLHRYSRTDESVKLILALTSGAAHADSNDGVFVTVGTVPISGDSFTRFCQWRDTVFAFGTSEAPRGYNTDEAATFQAITSRGAVDGAVADTFASTDYAGGTGTWTDSNTYSYRFTLDYYMGDNFIGESYPLHGAAAVGSAVDARLGVITEDDLYWKVDYAPSATTNHFQLKKGAGATLIDFGTDFPLAKTINIYRSVGAPTGSSLAASQTNARIMESEFFYVGSVECETFDAASAAAVLFTDYGFPGNGSLRLSGHETFEVPPKAKFATVHKGCVWYANIADTDVTFGALVGGQWATVTETAVNNISRIYYSRYYEPMSVGFKNWLEIQPNDGEGLTGIVSWKNRALFAFKPNSITGIYGGDEEITPGVLDLEIELVDENVGCIAPETIAFGEGGIIFLSNRGVMFFDGTTSTPIKSKLIDSILETMPDNRRQLAASVYDNKNRKYLIAFASEDEEETHNNVGLEYDFFTNTWTKHIFMDGSANLFGFNSFLELKRGDEAGTIVAACDATGASQVTTGAIQVLNDVYYESAGDEGVAWEVNTKYYDCGSSDTVKTFLTLLARVRTPHTINVSYDIDEGKVTGSLSDILPSTHVWDEAGLNWETYPNPETEDHFWGGAKQGETLLRFPQNASGRRVSLTFSGTSRLPTTELQGFTIKYFPEPRDET